MASISDRSCCRRLALVKSAQVFNAGYPTPGTPTYVNAAKSYTSDQRKFDSGMGWSGRDWGNYGKLVGSAAAAFSAPLAVGHAIPAVAARVGPHVIGPIAGYAYKHAWPANRALDFAGLYDTSIVPTLEGLPRRVEQVKSVFSGPDSQQQGSKVP